MSSSDRKYASLARSLERRLRAGQWGSDQPLPSNRNLVREFGVSLVTVRSALDQLGQRGLLRRVPGIGIFADHAALARTAEEGEVNPYGRSRLLAPDELAGLVVAVVGHRWQRDAQHANLCWERLVRGAEFAVSHGGGRSRLLLVPPDSPETPAAWLGRLQEVGANAVLAMGDRWHGGQQEALVAQLRQRGVPMVQVYGSFTPPLATHTITVDSARGIQQAVAHLRALGHQRLGYVGWDEEWEWLRLRQQTFRALVPTGPVLRLPKSGPTSAAHRQAITPLARTCTALVCANDDLAAIAHAALTAAGHAVPGDVALTGFDDDTAFRELELTTVGLPLEEVSVAAVGLLARALTEDLAEAVHHLQLAPRLLARQTTAPPRSGAAPTP